MKKLLAASLAVAMIATLAACGSPAPAASGAEKKELTGVGEGFGGPLKVAVTMEGDKITAVTVTENSETPNVAGAALTDIPASIVKAGKADVDAVSGATVTSNAIIYAVNNAIDPAAFPAPAGKAEAEEKKNEAIQAAKATFGTGVSFSPRMGPGKDDTETPVYSFNQVFATAVFDDAGKILHLNVDQLEVATPNYDGDGMPHFSGFPGQGGYNYDDNHDGKIDGKKTGGTEDEFTAEIAGWQTKRERGDSYKMGTGTWAQQMNAFEQKFVGMTVEEVEAWYSKYCSDLNGRPLKIGEKSKDEDKAKFDALSDAEKAELAELTSSATMSLNDSHGDIIAAIVKSLDNKVAVDITIG